jgi:uncharacterized DUF497 family protein
MVPSFRRTVLPFGPEACTWDEAKDASNFEKHGMNLAAAAQIFRGEILVRRDTRVTDEIRHQAIGVVGAWTVFVVYTVRDGAPRLISARRASTVEERIYGDR